VTRKTKFGFNENQIHHDQLIPKHAYLKDHNHFKNHICIIDKGRVIFLSYDIGHVGRKSTLGYRHV